MSKNKRKTATMNSSGVSPKTPGKTGSAGPGGHHGAQNVWNWAAGVKPPAPMPEKPKSKMF